LFHEGDQISPLFHEGAQDVQLINLSILPPWVADFRAAETKLVSRRLVLEPGFEDGGGMVGQIKVREMRRKRYKATSPVLDRRPFADRDGSASSVR
jgi:hypothetical protein